MSRAICFIGVMGSGKDHRAKLLKQVFNKVGFANVHINFADELREMMWDLLDWKPQDEDEYDSFKVGKFTHQFTLKELTGRDLLQRFGTEVIRKRHPSYWVDCWHDKAWYEMSKGNFVICTDLRFPNELNKALLLKDVTFIFCNYKSGRYDANNPHESEKLAQRILADGYEDGDVLTKEYLTSLVKEGFDVVRSEDVETLGR